MGQTQTRCVTALSLLHIPYSLQRFVTTRIVTERLLSPHNHAYQGVSFIILGTAATKPMRVPGYIKLETLA